MSKVAIVTDSTATLPEEMLRGLPIHVVPLVVIWGDETYQDGIDIHPEGFYRRLAISDVMPTTSQASVESFKDVFTKLHQQEYDILCVLISSKLSGTIGSAELAKQEVPAANVEIVDSLAAAMAMGFQAHAAAKAAADGASLADCKSLAEKGKNHTGVILTPETLKFLHRGGRIGGGARFLATALNIKPILELQDGRIEALERVRTRKKVLRRLVDLLEERVGGRTPVRVATVHANSPDVAKSLLEEANKRLTIEEAVLSEVSPAIGVHTGPGTVGITFMAGM